MFHSKPDRAAARKELNANLTLFAISVVAVRARTYVLELLSERED